MFALVYRGSSKMCCKERRSHVTKLYIKRLFALTYDEDNTSSLIKNAKISDFTDNLFQCYGFDHHFPLEHKLGNTHISSENVSYCFDIQM